MTGSAVNFETKLFIDNDFRSAASGKTFVSVNPATGGATAEIAEGDAVDVQEAVRAALRGFARAQKMKPVERQNMLLRLADLIEAQASTLAHIQSIDMGMPVTVSTALVNSCVEFCRYYAGWATKLYGDTVATSAPGEFHAYTSREPLGVVAGVIPWNSPFASALYKLCPAIATGNSIVLKPAEEAPLSVLAIGRLIIEAGWPEGLVNIVPGYGHTAGAALCAHDQVAKVAFTGSVETARKIAIAATGNMKRLTVELGGKSPNIIMSDADLDLAVPQSGWAVFGLTGQLCVAGSRVFVQRPIYDEFLDRLKSYAETLAVGDPLDQQTRLGPVVSDVQLNRVQGFIEAGEAEGARLLFGGGRLTDGAIRNGYFLQPTIFADVEDRHSIAREEIFGPVASVLPFETLDEVVERANESRYGLAAGIYTRDVRNAHLLAKNVQAGVVWVNCYGAGDASMSFGGSKESGYGREKGRLVLDDYTQIKNVWVGLN